VPGLRGLFLQFVFLWGVLLFFDSACHGFAASKALQLHPSFLFLTKARLHLVPPLAAQTRFSANFPSQQDADFSGFHRMC